MTSCFLGKLRHWEVILMSGRNNKPDNDGVASQPSRLDQFGEQLAEDHNVQASVEACDTADKTAEKPEA
jgi:hypothetical protein